MAVPPRLPAMPEKANAWGKRILGPKDSNRAPDARGIGGGVGAVKWSVLMDGQSHLVPDTAYPAARTHAHPLVWSGMAAGAQDALECGLRLPLILRKATGIACGAGRRGLGSVFWQGARP